MLLVRRPRTPTRRLVLRRGEVRQDLLPRGGRSRLARSGSKNPKRPIGSFIFLGASGVGKTELAKALAEFLFDDEEALIRIDMSEYQERHTVSRMFGAPPGYVGYDEGGQLTEAVRRRPYRVILFDEVEKAHPEVWNSLLQILEDGRLTDGQGHVVDFRNTVIIMTSNIGTAFVKSGGTLGFLKGDALTSQDRQLRESIESDLKRTFRPEFMNRIDEVIIFHGLTQEHVVQIVDLQMRAVAERLSEHGVKIELTEAGADIDAGKLVTQEGLPGLQPHPPFPCQRFLLRLNLGGQAVVAAPAAPSSLRATTIGRSRRLTLRTVGIIDGEIVVGLSRAQRQAEVVGVGQAVGDDGGFEGDARSGGLSLEQNPCHLS